MTGRPDGAGRVEIRVIGQAADVALVARLLRDSPGLDVLGQSRQRDAGNGVRVYIDGRIPAAHVGCDSPGP